MAYGTIAADQIQTSVTGSNLGAGNASNFKNRLINGSMVLDQRNAGASVTPTNGQYTLDRWQANLTQASKYTVQQTTTAPTGFVNSLKVTSSSAYSVGASDQFNVLQKIEGFNIADMNFGTINAKTFTLSFWVYSSLTGTFSGSVNNGAFTRNYIFNYTVSSANTWTQISVTIAGDTSGSWTTDNSAGLNVVFGLGSGSTYSGTAGSWGSTYYTQSTGSVSVVGTNAATWYITGVQLEVGSSATGFEYRDYGRELILCQRYFEKSWDIGTAVGTGTTVGEYTTSNIYGTTTTSYLLANIEYKVTKRTLPTTVGYDETGASGVCTRGYVGVGSANGQSVGFQNGGFARCQVYSSGTYAGTGIFMHWTASAEL